MQIYEKTFFAIWSSIQWMEVLWQFTCKEIKLRYKIYLRNYMGLALVVFKLKLSDKGSDVRTKADALSIATMCSAHRNLQNCMKNNKKLHTVC